MDVHPAPTTPLKMEIYREFTLECAHFLPNVPEGHKCGKRVRAPGDIGVHGHTYRVEVYLSGPYDPITGWLVDYQVLDDIWYGHVHRELDHRTLNDVVGLSNPTSELIALWMASRLAPPLAALGIVGLVLSSIVIHETARDGCRVTFDGAAVPA